MTYYWSDIITTALSYTIFELLSRHCGLMRWDCPSVCMFVRLSPKCEHKNAIFSKTKQFKGMVSWRPIGSHTWAFQRTHYRTPKTKMAEIRHFENRHDVIFLPWAVRFGCRLVQNGMPTAVIWSKSKPEVEFQY